MSEVARTEAEIDAKVDAAYARLQSIDAGGKGNRSYAEGVKDALLWILGDMDDSDLMIE